MKKSIFIALAASLFTLLATAEYSLADSWVSAHDIENKNKEMRARAESDARKTDELKKKWDEDAPQRELREARLKAMDREVVNKKAAVNLSDSAQPPESLVNACLEKYKPWFKDPRSVYVVSSSFSNDGRKIVIDGRAKNSYGAYMPGNFTCVLSSENTIDAKGTEAYVAMFRLGG